MNYDMSEDVTAGTPLAWGLLSVIVIDFFFPICYLVQCTRAKIYTIELGLEGLLQYSGLIALLWVNFAISTRNTFLFT